MHFSRVPESISIGVAVVLAVEELSLVADAPVQELDLSGSFGITLLLAKMKKVALVLCFSLILLAAAVGQFVSYDFWSVAISFSASFHPDAAWVLGGIVVFSLIPSFMLLVACVALARDAWKRKMGRSVAILSVSSIAAALWMLFATGGEAPLLWWVIVAPFVAIHVGAAIGFSVVVRENG